jgi:DNA-binding NtrC family response regulator
MNDEIQASARPDTVLVVESDVLVRTAIAEYLRHCGYRAIEAASSDDAITVLTEPSIPVGIVLSAADVAGSMNGFGLAKWVRENRPGLQVVLAGNVVKAAHVAGDLCEEGPHVQKPYEPQQVVEWIKRLRNIKV